MIVTWRVLLSSCSMSDTQQQRLKRTFEALRQALEEAESALIEFEETLDGNSSIVRPEGQRGFDLLSIPEACQELGMGKSWVYRRLKSGEIPSIKLGHNIKIKREDLERYLESQRYKPASEAE
jgi:excisionase family DNA binding protein